MARSPQAPAGCRFPRVDDPTLPPLRPERHVTNSITTMRRRLTVALATTLSRCQRQEATSVLHLAVAGPCSGRSGRSRHPGEFAVERRRVTFQDDTRHLAHTLSLLDEALPQSNLLGGQR